jgi:decaprenylphospho-beta-D-ribofuranose 2-oxidase
MTKQIIQSFDKTLTCECYYEKPTELNGLKIERGLPVIARGAGMSYCNATSVDGGLTLDMGSFNKVIEFDKENGYINAEAGICIGELNNRVIADGWQMPVLPGYPMITVGGCIGFNVHGKAQYKIGLFGDWVEELKLFHPSKGEIVCSRNQNAEVFDLTIGGMGFTGIIISAKLRLKKINGNQMQITAMKAANMDEAVKIITEKNAGYDYVYSWNNFNLSSRSFGKGIVYMEKIKNGFNDKVKPVQFKNRLLPHKQTPVILNKFTIYWMCQVYSFMNAIKPADTVQSLSASSFPIYSKEIYYHLFGRSGFREYQVIFPFNEWREALEKIKKLVSDSKMGIALASLKLFSGKTHNISFSGEGVCLAMDIPNNKRSIDFFERLDEISIAHKGIINLSKDSRAGVELVRAVYPGYEDFKRRLNEFDSERIFVSELRNRLKF